MGVYVRHFGSPATYVDLTNWVQWEDADVQWEVGAASRQLADDVAAGSTAYLGANPAVAERATDSANPWTAPGSFFRTRGPTSALAPEPPAIAGLVIVSRSRGS